MDESVGSEASDILATFGVKDLRSLAAAYAVDVEKCKSRGDIVKRLLASSAIRGRLGGPEFRVRPLLAAKSVQDLRALAKEHAVDVSTCERKSEFVDRIAGSPGAVKVLSGPPKEPAGESPAEPARASPSRSRRLPAPPRGAKSQPAEPREAKPRAPPRSPRHDARVPVGKAKPARAVAAATQGSGPGDAGAPAHAPHQVMSVPAVPRPSPVDQRILSGRDQNVDFGAVEDILDQTRMRFEERNFERTLALSREALVLAQGTLVALERSAWSYALLAGQRLIEESGRTGRDVEAASAILREAKDAYVSGSLGGNEALLAHLQAATQSLYPEEAQRVLRIVQGAQDRISHTAHIGGRVTAAEEAIGHAREAMQRSDNASALQYATESMRFADGALAARIKEIGAAMHATERVIEEARHVDADVGEAVRLLEKAKVAMERREYVLAADLVQRAEHACLESQHVQIQKAMELRRRQIEKAHGRVSYLVPIVDEAADYDFPVEELRGLLLEARSVLDQGDYVKGAILAREAEDLVRPMLPQIVEERGRRGIVKPPIGTFRCGACGSPDVAFLDDGWSRCNQCSTMWRWRAPSGLWERFRALLRE